jgi:hypothetical protein
MKTVLIFIASLAALVFMSGCSEDSPTDGNTPRNFDGITMRDEFGDTLQGVVDTTDWVITGPQAALASDGADMLPAGSVMLIPRASVTDGSDDGTDDINLGAFPNPFIPRSGRVLIELILLSEVDLRLHMENESGSLNVTLLDTSLFGAWLVAWSGYLGEGRYLADGMYRFFFDLGAASSFGDVQVIHSQDPDPPDSAAYVLYAQDFFDLTAYGSYEYKIARDYGPSGILAGPDRYEGAQAQWETLNYGDRFVYLPIFFNYDWEEVGQASYQYHHLLAYKHFQFGAGWPTAGNNGPADTTQAQWQQANTFHDHYVELFEGGPAAQ